MKLGRVLFALACMAAGAPAQPFVAIVTDLIDVFPEARTNDCLECTVRLAASAAGIRRPSLFEHPRTGGKPARIEYDLALPAVTNQQRLMLTFDLALSDGIKLGPEIDGVRFGIEADGRRIFTRDIRESRWEPHVLDLTAHAGRTLRLTLLTEGIGNTAYDWALWGQPRVLRLPSETLADVTHTADGAYSLSCPIGVVAVQLPAQTRCQLHLRPDVGPASEFAADVSAPTNATSGWWLREFSFPAARSVTVDWEPRSALNGDHVRVAAFPSKLRLTQFGPAHAVTIAGQPLILRTEVINSGPGKLAPGQARIELLLADQAMPARPIPALAPGQHFRAEWRIAGLSKPGRMPLTARVQLDQVMEERATEVELFALRRPTPLIENEFLSLCLSRQPRGYAFAELSARDGEDWIPMGLLAPLFRVVLDTGHGEREWKPLPRNLRRFTPPGEAAYAELHGQTRDPDGVLWQTLLRVTLDANAPRVRLHYEWKAGRDRSVRALWGPNLYLGDGTLGEAKSWALFPGLEYLYGPEQSSNPRDIAPNLADRRTPDPAKITAPLLALTIAGDSELAPESHGRFFTSDSLKDRGTLRPFAISNSQFTIQKSQSPFTVSLHWDPLQKWDGEHALPSARFSSPNLDEGQVNHRLGLFLPSVPDFVPENGDRATTAFELKAGQTLRLDATLSVTRGPAMSAMREWLQSVGGLPKPTAWPRTFQEELDLCRAGFLETVWDSQTEKWRHCLDLKPDHAPGFAALLWLDSQLAESPEARKRSRERVQLAAGNMLRDGGPAQFTSQANCHIMQWEFPFLYGHLSGSLDALEAQVQGIIGQQRPDGGWVFQPAGPEQRDLGQPGDSVLGTCAQRAMTLLRYARITGDTNALAAGEHALRFMEQFRVPRGGQTWECPMYEPDILAAAYAVRAYLDAWRVTGNPRWLHDAVYWAETGVPFVYLWTLPDKPMMLGATIPVFGSTFYTHSWLGVPVQWCGLVYAYHLWHLAQELEGTPMPKSDSPLPLSLGFSAADWKRVVELITASAVQQQESGGPRKGTYPDSISNFERKNPLFINPEDILLNVLAVQGIDADVQSARVKWSGADLVISSGAKIRNAQATPTGVRFDLIFFPHERSHTLMTSAKPREVRVNGNVLNESATPLQRDTGWWWDAKCSRLYLTVPHASEKPVAIEAVR